MRCGAYLSTKMAAWRASLTRDDMCSSCFSNTLKYTCLKCTIPICNKCSTFELDENTEKWAAGRCVGYCEPCFREKRTTWSRKSQVPADCGLIPWWLEFPANLICFSFPFRVRITRVQLYLNKPQIIRCVANIPMYSTPYKVHFFESGSTNPYFKIKCNK